MKPQEPIDLEREQAARDTLLDALQEELGPRLQAVYHFGSEVARGKGEGHPRVLVLIDAIDRGTLDRIRGCVNDAQTRGVRVRVDCTDNLLQGADAFPSFALELRDSRELLRGDDVLASLEVDLRHLRLHVEQGLRSLHRDLIKSYVERELHGEDVLTLRRRTRKLLFLLEGALICAGRASPDAVTVDGIVDAACGALLPDCDMGPWDTIKVFARGERKFRGPDATELYDALLRALPQMIDVIDGLPDPQEAS